ncbi:hypothetical protein QR98_0031310 [Sarcoptes scabiei]|uniref:MYND-type domain-containing protein n=1 Tax=Sarcoptes scabiei TaxID=52283 RepID=A0A132A2Y6_SARSC|nr:hypothetical protein QR98_0031310 [Sarcoptes scabiei]
MIEVIAIEKISIEIEINEIIQRLNVIYKCPGCSSSFYCGIECQNSDFSNHQWQCRLNLIERVKRRIENITKEEILDENVFDLNEYFEPNDLVEYTVLFFNFLKKSQNFLQNKTNSNISWNIGNLHQTTCWDDLSSSISLRSSHKRLKKNGPDLSDYISKFDLLTHEEKSNLDRILGIELPDDDYFKSAYVENIAKFVLKNLIDSVCDDLYGDYSIIHIGKDEMLKKIKAKQHDSEENESTQEEMMKEEKLFRVFVDELQKKKFWDKLKKSHMPLEQLTNYLSNNMFDLWLKSRKNSLDALSNDEVENNILEDLDESFVFDSLPNDGNYQSISLKFDSSIIEKNENEAIESMKTNYRLMYLEILNQKPASYETELDYYFGSWLDEILKLLAEASFQECFGSVDYCDIEKVFLITLRYSIVVTDESCMVPIARSIYLPLTQIQHSCLPNTSPIFDGNRLKIYMLPANRLNSKLKTSKNLLTNIKDVKLDFNHECSIKESSVKVYVLNKLRFLNCVCNRCEQVKQQVHLQINNLFDQIVDDQPQADISQTEDIFIDDLDLTSPDFEFLREDLHFEMSKNDLIRNSKDFTLKCESIPQTNLDSSSQKSIDYDFVFGRLSKANLLYGNRLDLEYSNRLQDLLIDMIGSFRSILGHYHKQITILLILMNFCNHIIIKSQKDKLMIFYRVKFLHQYIVELIDAVALSLISVAAAVPYMAGHDLDLHAAAPLVSTHSVAVAGPAIHAGYAAPALHAVHAPAGLGGNGFGYGGHFSPMPVQEVKLVPVPQPVPVAQPYPVDKPYAVPVDKPYTVPIDKPIAAPYVAKVIQPMVHKQTVVSSHVLSAHK